MEEEEGFGCVISGGEWSCECTYVLVDMVTVWKYQRAGSAWLFDSIDCGMDSAMKGGERERGVGERRWAWVAGRCTRGNETDRSDLSSAGHGGRQLGWSASFP